MLRLMYKIASRLWMRGKKLSLLCLIALVLVVAALSMISKGYLEELGRREVGGCQKRESPVGDRIAERGSVGSQIAARQQGDDIVGSSVQTDLVVLPLPPSPPDALPDVVHDLRHGFFQRPAETEQGFSIDRAALPEAELLEEPLVRVDSVPCSVEGVRRVIQHVSGRRNTTTVLGPTEDPWDRLEDLFELAIPKSARSMPLIRTHSVDVCNSAHYCSFHLTSPLLYVNRFRVNRSGNTRRIMAIVWQIEYQPSGCWIRQETWHVVDSERAE